MSDFNDGGPAFPVADFDFQAFAPGTTDDVRRLLSGMSLRTYIAVEAMKAAITAKNDEPMRGYDGWREEFAREAYRYADSMIEVGTEPPPTQFRPLYPSEQAKVNAAVRLAQTIEDLKRDLTVLPVGTRELLERAVADVLDPEIPF